LLKLSGVVVNALAFAGFVSRPCHYSTG